ncbi:MAG: hypothetical protein AB4042_08830 [Leptolyngbyaceae cyanobacterium]
MAEAIVKRAKTRALPTATVKFDYDVYEGKVTILEPLRGQQGLLSLSLFTVEALEQAEDHLIFAAMTDGGRSLDVQQAQRLLSLPGMTVAERIEASCLVSEERLMAMTQEQQRQLNRERRSVWWK